MLLMKSLSNFYNFLLLICGFILMGYGVYILSQILKFDYFFAARVILPPYFAVFVAISVVGVAAFGFYAFADGSNRIIIVFAVLLFVSLMMELLLLMFCAMAQANASDSLKLSFRRSFSNYSFTDVDKKAWNYMQKKLTCCGMTAPKDWDFIFAWNQVPASCCLVAPSERFGEAVCRFTRDSSIIYQSGCHSTLLRLTLEKYQTLAFLTAAFAALKIVGILLCIAAVALSPKQQCAQESCGGFTCDFLPECGKRVPRRKQQLAILMEAVKETCHSS